MALGNPKIKSAPPPSGSSQGGRWRQESYVVGTVMGKYMTVGLENFHSVSGPVLGREINHLPGAHIYLSGKMM